MSVDRSRLPPLGPVPRFRPPAFRRQTLDNGIRVWTVSHRRAPVLTFRLLLPVGSAADPRGRTGLAALTGDLLDEGTQTRSDVELHEALTRLGAHLGIDTSSDATVLSLTTLPRHAVAALRLLVEVVTRPRFAATECRRVRDLRLNRLRQLRRVPSSVVDRVFIEALYAGHPYGHLTLGTDDDVKALEPDDVSAFHRRWYHPTAWTLVAVGDLSGDELHDVARAVLAEVPVNTPTPSTPIAPPVGPPPRVDPSLVFVSRPGAVQSELRLGHAGPPRSSSDYHALLVLNMVLGGQFVSRINLNLREAKGYTYGARSGFDWRVGCGPFSVRTSVQTPATADAVTELIGEIGAIRERRPVTDDELVAARAALTRGFPRGFETATDIARAGTTLALHGLPPDEMSRFVERVESVDTETVTRVAQSGLDPDRLVAVVVGSPDDVLRPLERVGFGAARLVD